MDVTRLNGAVRGPAIEHGADFASSLVAELVRHESAKVAFELDIASEDLDKRENSLALYYALTQGIVRGAEAIYKECGLRSLWLAYPFLLARDITDEKNRSILAPLYLWPIQIQASLKHQGEIVISRDPQAGAPVFNRVLARWVKINLNVEIPAVELDQNGDGDIELSELNGALNSMLQGFAGLQPVDLTGCVASLPVRRDAEGMPQPAVLNGAVLGLFLSENQALIENLEKLQQVPQVDEPLDSILANRQAAPDTVSLPAETDRYLVTDSDPYQELAIWESRQSPGSIVHGPPGTGKSQTIVNIVADSLARGERVLLVCQKRAAIDVVAERLRGVGLDDLCVVVHDSESDRRQIFSDLKEQINALRDYVPSGFAAQRHRLAEEIDRRESELEKYHKALHQPRQTIGLSYRQLIGKATALYNANTSLTSSAQIEALFSGKGGEELDRAEEQLQELAHLWEAARPAVNPWTHRISDFALTRPIYDEIGALLQSCLAAVQHLDDFTSAQGTATEIEGDPATFAAAASEWKKWTVELLQAGRLERCAYWLQRLATEIPTDATVRLEQLSSLADHYTRISEDPRIEPVLSSCKESALESLIQAVPALKKRKQRGWWVVVTPSFRKAMKCWKSLALDDTLRENIDTLDAIEQQSRRRAIRMRVLSGLASLDIPASAHASDSDVLRMVRANLFGGRDASKLITAAKKSRLVSSLLTAIRTQDTGVIENHLGSIGSAITRAQHVNTLAGALNTLARWLEASFLAEQVAKAQAGMSVRPTIEALRDHLGKLQQLCAFDAACGGASELVSQTLGALESVSGAVEGEVWSRWKTLLRYSTYSGWIASCLAETPILKSLTPDLYERDRKALAAAIKKKRALEVDAIKDRCLEAQCTLHGLRPSPLIALRSLLVTRGPNSKRLRQAVALGADKGLFQLRPCWMMNPNTACQIFPLSPGLFDVVIFDEASQCPLEQAVPILYRGRRAVVAGDEKQLPPTSFFLSVTPFDGEDSNDEDITEEEQMQRDLQLNVLATKDLLGVSESVLRNSYLDMHYRSEHPLLIQFSNKAFYGGRLQCPPSVRWDGVDVPILVRDVNGVYDHQTNSHEAIAVVALLRDLWLVEDFPGTLGVVTFNEKQKDLIQNLLQQEALRDEQFRLKYEAECDRKEGRQDVSFFVKNLESVQGDERDVMIFSTTFGADSQGQFKRLFGPLNLDGGERRLNVAVTRAKKRIYVLTSLPVAQISDTFGATGARPAMRVTGRDYLQAYMRYADAVSKNDPPTRVIVERQLAELAKMAGLAAPKSGAVADFDSDFEISVYEALIKRGLKVDQQVGDSGFRIDLAVRHPREDDTYVLGIECDGRTYHSKFTARARDIWRQQILESRGWKIHRIWSTDWWLNPQAEIEKVLARVSASA